MVLQVLVNWGFPMCHEVTGSLSLVLAVVAIVRHKLDCTVMT